MNKTLKYKNKIKNIQDNNFKEKLLNEPNKEVINKLNQEIDINNIINVSLHQNKYHNTTCIILSIEDYYNNYELINGFFIRKNNIIDINKSYDLKELINDNKIPDFNKFEQILKNTIIITKLIKCKKLKLDLNKFDLNILNKFIFQYLNSIK